MMTSNKKEKHTRRCTDLCTVYIESTPPETKMQGGLNEDRNY